MKPSSTSSYRDNENESAESLLGNNGHTIPRRRITGLINDVYVRFAAFQVLLILLYTILFFLFSYKSINHGSCTDTATVYSPAREAVKFERVRFNATLVIDSPYNGVPSPEVDAAWKDLLDNMNIAVPGSDLELIGASSIPIPGTTDQYIAGLSVFHELHCLKRIRQYTWPDYYHPNLTAEDARLNRLHADHCIDVLRQAILCRSDISLFTLEWSESEPMPRADFSHEHTCVNWREVFDWAGKRKVSEDILKNLKHPHFGSAFPHGMGSTLGASEDHSPSVSS